MFPYADIVQKELLNGAELSDLFLEFDEKPLGSASIAQVSTSFYLFPFCLSLEEINSSCLSLFICFISYFLLDQRMKLRMFISDNFDIYRNVLFTSE